MSVRTWTLRDQLELEGHAGAVRRILAGRRYRRHLERAARAADESTRAHLARTSTWKGES